MRPREEHLIKEFLTRMNAERRTDFAFRTHLRILEAASHRSRPLL